MSMVTVSPKYQVVIPKDIREEMDIKPGQKVQMMIYRGNIVLVPLRPIEELRGFLQGVVNLAIVLVAIPADEHLGVNLPKAIEHALKAKIRRG